MISIIDSIKKLLVAFLVASSFVNIYAQDLHFSQFYSSPLTLNPAHTGSMKEDFRLAGIRRDQWSGIASSFITTALSGEISFRDGFLNEDKLALGIVLYDDNMGEGTLKSQSLLLSTAYHHTLDAHRLHDLSLGAQIGVMRKRLNEDGLQFENQFQDWEFQESLSNGENFDILNQNHFSLHIGALWKYTITPKKLRYHLGFSTFQITSPSETFLKNGNNELNTRFTIHTGIDYRITPKLVLSPKFLFMTQSNARDINLGTMLGYEFTEDFILLGGYWNRLYDSHIGMIGTRIFKNYELKFSYDLTNSSLRDSQNAIKTANDGRVASWEISLIVVGNIFKSHPIDYTIPCGIF